jgi:hypothetical protein
MHKVTNMPWPAHWSEVDVPQLDPHNRLWVRRPAFEQELNKLAAELVGPPRLGLRDEAADVGQEPPGCGRADTRCAEAQSQDGNPAALPFRRGTSEVSEWPRSSNAGQRCA